MATQTIEFGAPAGQTVTARLFAAGSDVVVATATATARTNATGVYTAAFSNLTPGLYRLIGTNAAGTLLCQWWTLTESATATYQAYEVPPSIVVDGVWNALDANYTLAGSFGAKLIRSTNSNNQVSLTGGPTPHIAADVHAFQAGVITTAAFAVGAITSGVIATDAIGSDELAAAAVTKIQLGLGLASANLDTQLAGIQSDTNDIQSRLPAALIAGRMDSNVQAIAAGVVTQIQTGLSTLTAGQVNAEVLDVLATDLFGELAAVPGASSSLKDKIAFLFMLARNKVTQTSSTQTLFADNTTTPVAAATTSDVGGTFTRGEFA